MRKNGYLGASGQKFDPDIPPETSISYSTNAFPLPSDVYRIYLMFLCHYIVWPCDLDLWNFDSVSYTVPPMPDTHTNFDYSTIIGYWVMNYWIGSHFRYQKQSLRMRSITWPEHMVSPKTTRNIFDAELSIHYTTFVGLGWRLLIVYIGAKWCFFAK